ncbi:MAG: hypothetical protein FK733_03705 [Asgard group archaeon]|nr:hypothetical protein [Asgard group archaeon]
MSLLQKYRKDEVKKPAPEEDKKTTREVTKATSKKAIAPKEPVVKRERKTQSKEPGSRSRPVISATVSLDLVEALNDLTDEKYLNRSKFIEDALKRTIKTEFPDIASRYGF